MDTKNISANIAGADWKFETGHMANQANGAVTLRVGDTMVLATAVMKSQPRDGIDFFHKAPNILDESLRLIIRKE